MSLRRSLFVLTVLGLSALPHHASAQLSIGGSVGRVFDQQDNWIVLGAEARYAVKDAFEFNPRLTYNHEEGGSTTQVDANLLYRPALAGKAQVQPYVGAGLAIVHESFGDFSETKPAFNAVAGINLTLEGSKLRPFLHTQYTAAKDFGNLYTMSVGVVFPIR